MKTIEEAEALREEIERQIESLPATNHFGESNSAEKANMRRYAASLKAFVKGNKIESKEVRSWLDGPDDYFLKDFLA